MIQHCRTCGNNWSDREIVIFGNKDVSYCFLIMQTDPNEAPAAVQITSGLARVHT